MWCGAYCRKMVTLARTGGGHGQRIFVYSTEIWWWSYSYRQINNSGLSLSGTQRTGPPYYLLQHITVRGREHSGPCHKIFKWPCFLHLCFRCTMCKSIIESCELHWVVFIHELPLVSIDSAELGRVKKPRSRFWVDICSDMFQLQKLLLKPKLAKLTGTIKT